MTQLAEMPTTEVAVSVDLVSRKEFLLLCSSTATKTATMLASVSVVTLYLPSSLSMLSTTHAKGRSSPRLALYSARLSLKHIQVGNKAYLQPILVSDDSTTLTTLFSKL
jgi:hypothetical protein